MSVANGAADTSERSRRTARSEAAKKKETCSIARADQGARQNRVRGGLQRHGPLYTGGSANSKLEIMQADGSGSPKDPISVGL